MNGRMWKVRQPMQYLKYLTSFFVYNILNWIGNSLIAQDTHYNGIQIGARSVLMGGAVVGNVRDNTAVLYNPPALAFVDTSNISLNGNAYQVDNIRIYNAVGDKKDFTSTQLGSNPLFLGGMISSQKHPLKIGYSVMNFVDFNFKATARVDSYVPVADDSESPGEEEFIGQASINSNLNELVFALGAGYRLSENWSVGITNMVVVRTNYFTRINYSRFFMNNPARDLVSASFSRMADYYNARDIIRLGLNYRLNRFSAGLTFNAPSINILGLGKISADVIGNNIRFNGKRTVLLANDRQDKLKTRFKSPFAVAGGINYIARKSAIGFSCQYFTGIGAYDVMQAKPAAFVRPAELYPELGSEEFLKLKTAAKPVFNFAVGYEYALKPKLVLSGSFRTNQSYYDPDLQKTVAIKTEVTSWNINHYTVGSTFIAGRSKLTLGFLYSHGKDGNRRQEGNLDDPDEGNFLQGKTVVTKAVYNSFGLLLGYTFGLQSKI